MKQLKVFLVPVLAGATLGVVGTTRYVRAQEQPEQPAYGQQHWDWSSEDSERQIRSFDMFLHEHPYISKKIWEHPGRVNDRGFVNDNKELRQWLDDHPEAAMAFRDDPDGFMERERHFQVYGADFQAGDHRRGDLAHLDWFLDGHPEIRHDLMHKPQLVDDRGYLDGHPALREFLNAHPGLGAELQDHPREFMDREARYEHM